MRAICLNSLTNLPLSLPVPRLASGGCVLHQLAVRRLLVRDVRITYRYTLYSVRGIRPSRQAQCVLHAPCSFASPILRSRFQCTLQPVLTWRRDPVRQLFPAHASSNVNVRLPRDTGWTQPLTCEDALPRGPRLRTSLRGRWWRGIHGCSDQNRHRRVPALALRRGPAPCERLGSTAGTTPMVVRGLGLGVASLARAPMRALQGHVAHRRHMTMATCGHAPPVRLPRRPTPLGPASALLPHSPYFSQPHHRPDPHHHHHATAAPAPACASRIARSTWAALLTPCRSPPLPLRGSRLSSSSSSRLQTVWFVRALLRILALLTPSTTPNRQPP